MGRSFADGCEVIAHTLVFNGVHIPEHAHPVYHDCFVREGTARLSRDGEIETLVAPAVRRVEAGVAHWMDAVTPIAKIWCVFPEGAQR